MYKQVIILSVALFMGGCADGGASLRDALLNDMKHGMDWVGDASMTDEGAYNLKYYQATTRPYTSYHTRGAYPTVHTSSGHYK